MKKLIVLLTAVCFTLSFAAIFAACGKEEPAPVVAPTPAKVDKPAPTPIPKPAPAPEAPAKIEKKDDGAKKPPKPSMKPKTLKKKGGSKKKK